MIELFGRIVNGCPPMMVNLPTGCGKTDLAVVWLIALAYYGINREASAPIPRRLVWVVNRRVLVGQIYRLAKEIVGHLNSPNQDGTLVQLRQGLRSLNALENAGDPLFEVVQLRGQIMDDREWSINPAKPSLIIGTVDQIGSRLLFQGYGLGKSARPQQASLLGVDAWVVVDEAHLVPAFILTLRQVAERIARPMKEVPGSITGLFNQLPWWHSELSATPGLPTPDSSHQILSLSDADKDKKLTPLIAERIAAGKGKTVHLLPLSDPKKLKEGIALKALEYKDQFCTVAIYVRTPALAAGIQVLIEKGLKAGEKINPSKRVLVITGRMRGVERDELENDPVFQQFMSGRQPRTPQHTVYLIGTSAAEVGVDTDADVICCEFASLDTLLQRLGRLDRLGERYRKGQTAEMFVFGAPNPQPSIVSKAEEIGERLALESFQPSAALLSANTWVFPAGKEDGEEVKTKKNEIDEIVSSASLKIILEVPSTADWRDHALAPATIKPTLCQPLTDPVLQYWTATSLKPNVELPVQPWLYGLGEDENSTALVGLVFRLELDALSELPVIAAEEEGDEADSRAEDLRKKLSKLFFAHPPAKTEAHWIPLRTVRDWLNGQLEQPFPNKKGTAANEKSEEENAGNVPEVVAAPSGKKMAVPPPALIAWRDEEKVWQFADSRIEGENAYVIACASGLRPETILLLPTHLEMPKEISDELTNKSGGATDVAGIAWTSEVAAPWRRVVKDAQGKVLHGWLRRAGPEARSKGKSKKSQVDEAVIVVKAAIEPALQARSQVKWLDLRLGGGTHTFGYYRTANPMASAGENSNTPLLTNHQQQARDHAVRLLNTLIPKDVFMREFFGGMAAIHDEGKADPLWQRLAQRPGGNPSSLRSDAVAKYDHYVHPSKFQGYRHEWGTLNSEVFPVAMEQALSSVSADSKERPFYSELFAHVLGAHHGHFRPGLPDQPMIEARALAPLRLAASLRWHKLQQILGPWRLAYLETLLKAADIMASRMDDSSEK